MYRLQYSALGQGHVLARPIAAMAPTRRRVGFTEGKRTWIIQHPCSLRARFAACACMRTRVFACAVFTAGLWCLFAAPWAEGAFTSEEGRAQLAVVLKSAPEGIWVGWSDDACGLCAVGGDTEGKLAQAQAVSYPAPWALSVEPAPDSHRLLELVINTAGGNPSSRLWRPVVQAPKSGERVLQRMLSVGGGTT